MAAIDAIERHEIGGRPGSLMTGLAGCGLVWDLPPGVCKRRGRPVSGRMARRAGAGRRETRAGVVRNSSAKCCRAVPVGRMATVAVGRRHGGTGVAKVAGHGDVRTGQGEPGGAVVKDRSEPRGCGVAGSTSSWIGK